MRGRVETARLLLRPPTAADVMAIFDRYASDPEVTKYLSWPRHRSLAETDAFISFSEDQWTRWPAGPLLIFSRADGTLLGGTGLAFETPQRAMTGYVLARDSWGVGYATEALAAMVDLAREAGVRRCYAVCHVEHRASWRVMEKCGFHREGVWQRHTVFPNLSAEPLDVLVYARSLQPDPERDSEAETASGRMGAFSRP